MHKKWLCKISNKMDFNSYYKYKEEDKSDDETKEDDVAKYDPQLILNCIHFLLKIQDIKPMYIKTRCVHQ